MVWGLLKPHDTTIEHFEHCHNFLQMDTDGPELSLRLSNLWVKEKKPGGTGNWTQPLCLILGYHSWRHSGELVLTSLSHQSLCFSLTLLATSSVHLQPMLRLWLNGTFSLGTTQGERQRVACMELIVICSFLTVISDILVDSFLFSSLLLTANILFFRVCLLPVFLSSKWTFSKKSLTLDWLIS